MQRDVKRIHVVQAGLVLGVLYGGMGLLIGLIYSLVGLIVGVAGISSASSSGSGTGAGGSGVMELFAIFGGMGLLAAIFIPLMYGAFGFITGMIGALIYNLTAKIIGGFKFDVIDISMARHQVGTSQTAIGTDSAPPAQS